MSCGRRLGERHGTGTGDWFDVVAETTMSMESRSRDDTTQAVETRSVNINRYSSTINGSDWMLNKRADNSIGLPSVGSGMWGRAGYIICYLAEELKEARFNILFFQFNELNSRGQFMLSASTITKEAKNDVDHYGRIEVWMISRSRSPWI